MLKQVTVEHVFKKITILQKVLKNLRYYATAKPEFGAFIAFLVIFVGFSLVAPGFLSIATWASILTVVAELGVVAASVTLLMICGEFDLSVGSVLAITSTVCAILLRKGVNDFLAGLVTLVMGVCLGLLNGAIVVIAKIPSFITTLGTMMFWRGILLAITGGFPTIPYFGKSILFDALNSRIALDFRTSAFWFVLIMFIAYFVLHHTAYGNWVYATGGNKEAAFALGVPVKKVKLFNFMLTSIAASLAGLMQFARFRSVDALRGQGLELEVIAAVVTGGVLLRGGYGSILGALMGVLIVGMVRTGLLLAKAPPYWYQAFVGVVLVIAVVVNTRLRLVE